MSFIQVVECHTSQVAEVQELDREWERVTEGRNTVRRSILTRDRNDPEHYFVLVFFDSYESAMENSNLPETGEFAAKMSGLVDGPMAFHDLDVIEDKP